MEFFNKAKAVRLRSHLDKYLYAEEDQKTVRQSRNGTSSKVIWMVEIVPGNAHIIRLKSCYGLYLTASEEHFLLGMTGKKVLQTASNILESYMNEWEPIRDGFQVILRTIHGKYLRANGAAPPWRNSITHDKPHRSATKNWVLWDVDTVDMSRLESSVADYQSQVSSLSSTLSDLDDPDSPTSPWSMPSPKLSITSSHLSSSQLGMEYFRNAKAIRLKSHHDKFLHADEDEESVCQDRNGSSKTARWTVEFIHGESFIRLKSCFNKYLTASNAPFLLGMTGRKIVQTLPRRLDSSLEWEPVRDSGKVKLKTRYGNFLRANGGLPPWRNSITHDVPQRTSTQDWVLWDVDILEIQVHTEPTPVPPPPKTAPSPPPPPPQTVHQSLQSDYVDDEGSEVSEMSTPSTPSSSQPSTPSHSSFKDPSTPSNSSFKSFKSFCSSKLKPSDSNVSSAHKAVDGRVIHYTIADHLGNVEDGHQEASFTFKGNGVNELTQKLKEETEIPDIIVCSRSPLNGKLNPLRLQLPPNNATMHVVVVPSSSKVARDFAKPGLL